MKICIVENSPIGLAEAMACVTDQVIVSNIPTKCLMVSTDQLSFDLVDEVLEQSEHRPPLNRSNKHHNEILNFNKKFNKYY